MVAAVGREMVGAVHRVVAGRVPAVHIAESVAEEAVRVGSDTSDGSGVEAGTEVQEEARAVRVYLRAILGHPVAVIWGRQG